MSIGGRKIESGKWKVADKLMFIGEFFCSFLFTSEKKRTKRNAAQGERRDETRKSLAIEKLKLIRVSASSPP